MAASKRRFRAVFAEVAWREDMRRYRANPGAKDLALRGRQAAEAKGIDKDELENCEAEGRDGTRLANCVKLYLPPGEPEARFRDGVCGRR